MYRGLGATSYVSQVSALAPSYNIPPSLAVAVMNAESSGNPSAVSPKGAIGLFQLMPATAASLGVDPNDPTQNIQGGLTYLQQLYNQYGNWNDALIAYNEGPGNLANKGVFPSSQSYADGILSAAGISDASGPADSSTASSQDAVFNSVDTLSLPDLSSLSTGALALIFGTLALGVILISR